MLVFAPHYEEPDATRPVHVLSRRAEVEQLDRALAGMTAPQIRAAHHGAVFVVKDAYALVRAQTHFGKLQAAGAKLVLLAASPLLGDAAELAALVNLLRRVDGLPALSPDDPGFPAALCARAAFVSPRTFSSTRLLVDYPPNRVSDAPHLRHRVEFLDVHPVRCSAHQIQSYRAAATDSEKLRALTMSYPKHQGFEACVARSGERFAYTGERCFANLSKYSPKLAAVVRAVQDGSAVIYAPASALVAALALEEAGFRRFGVSLLDLPGGNGRRYADESSSAEELALADVKIVSAPGSFQVEQVHVLDPTPLGQVEDLWGQCPAAQVFLYASLIDLDEEALDLYFYRQAETAAEQVVRLFQPNIQRPADCFKEKLVFTRAELLRRFSREDLAALGKEYVVNRFGACGTVLRVDDLYLFEPRAPDAPEEEYLQACGLLPSPSRTWGRMAAAALRSVPPEERDRVVVAHVVESRGVAEREQLLRRVLEGRRSKFDDLVLAYFDRHCKFGDGYVLMPAAAVDPGGPVGAMGAGGFTLLARRDGRWVAANNPALHWLPLLESLSGARVHGDRDMVGCELELRLRLLDGERRWFLTPAEAASLK